MTLFKREYLRNYWAYMAENLTTYSPNFKCGASFRSLSSLCRSCLAAWHLRNLKLTYCAEIIKSYSIVTIDRFGCTSPGVPRSVWAVLGCKWEWDFCFKLFVLWLPPEKERLSLFGKAMLCYEKTLSLANIVLGILTLPPHRPHLRTSILVTTKNLVVSTKKKTWKNIFWLWKIFN